MLTPESEFDPCPLCEAPRPRFRHQDRSRCYIECTQCGLIYVPRSAHLSRTLELERYRLHENDVDDAGYRRYLAPLAEAILGSTGPGARGLDFGCGPGPALARMLEAAGRQMTLYDPFFSPDEGAWSAEYDFIVASEVFEHLHHPRAELDRLFGVLRGGGVLGVMTCFVPQFEADFAKWHYLNDLTHVCFYGRAVFEHIASHWNAGVAFPAPNVVLLTKGG